jgi:hypothetical protein
LDPNGSLEHPPMASRTNPNVAVRFTIMAVPTRIPTIMDEFQLGY